MNVIDLKELIEDCLDLLSEMIAKGQTPPAKKKVRLYNRESDGPRETEFDEYEVMTVMSTEGHIGVFLIDTTHDIPVCAAVHQADMPMECNLEGLTITREFPLSFHGTLSGCLLVNDLGHIGVGLINDGALIAAGVHPRSDRLVAV